MSKALQFQSASDNPAKVNNSTACNLDLKLGDNCDACLRGVMLPPGGLDYYRKILEDPNPPPPHGQEKIVCPRCGHWHLSTGSSFSSGYEEVKT
jgi:hypothetical protein